MQSSWRRYLEDFDEGLGTVYERLVLNDILRKIISVYKIKKVLEVPLYGIVGVPGINSFILVKNGCDLTLVDNNQERIKKVEKLWKTFNLKIEVKFSLHKNFCNLPFKDNSFDFVWNFASLWHLREAPQLIAEMARVSSNLILLVIQNNRSFGYFLRKYFLDKKLFREVYEDWIDVKKIKEIFKDRKITEIENKYFDIPPFPDFAMPIQNLLRIWSKQNEKSTLIKKWRWTIVEYYQGLNQELPDRISKLRIIDNSSLPQGLKSMSAHLRYVLGHV